MQPGIDIYCDRSRTVWILTWSICLWTDRVASACISINLSLLQSDFCFMGSVSWFCSYTYELIKLCHTSPPNPKFMRTCGVGSHARFCWIHQVFTLLIPVIFYWRDINRIHTVRYYYYCKLKARTRNQSSLARISGSVWSSLNHDQSMQSGNELDNQHRHIIENMIGLVVAKWSLTTPV